MPEFVVTYQYHATATDLIEADSLEQANALISAKVESDDFDPGFDDIDNVDWAVRKLTRVVRDGKECKVTHVRPTDTVCEEAA